MKQIIRTTNCVQFPLCEKLCFCSAHFCEAMSHYFTSSEYYHTHLTLRPLRLYPPLTIGINLLQRYIYRQFTLPLAIHGKFDKSGRTLRLQQTRGRLEFTVPHYIKSSYLLASDTLTKQLATRRQVHSYLVVVRKLHHVF